MWRVASLFVVAAALPPPAQADGIVIESYVGQRPDNATRLLAPFHEALATRDFATGDAPGRKYEAAVSRAALTKPGLPADFDDTVERGHKAWISGRFDDAIATLGPLVDAAHANAGAFAQNQPLRERLQKALIALALSQQRKGDQAAAKTTVGEVLRSFPDAQVSRAQYGPEAFELFDQARRASDKSGRGRLTVKTPSDNAVVFINEKFENVGTVDKSDLAPGEYRVFVQIGKQPSRVHRVTVQANEDTKLAVDMPFDVALRTGPGWTGFVFANQSDRDKHEARFALDFARQVGAKGLIVVGITSGRAITGALIDLPTGKEIRRASLAIEPEPTADRLRSLARFLGGDEPSSGIEVQLREDPPAPTPDQPETPEVGSDKQWMKWTGIAAIGIGLVGGGLAIKFALDAHAAGDELDRVCAVSCTSAQALALQHEQQTANRNAIISGVAGGAAIVAGAALVVLWRRSHHATVALVPTRGGTMAALGITF